MEAGVADGDRRRLGAMVALLSRRQALEILWALERGSAALRYGELRRMLRAAPVTFTRRLVELEAAGLVVRHSSGGIPRRVEYSLTPEARDLLAGLRGVASRAEGLSAAPSEA